MSEKCEFVTNAMLKLFNIKKDYYVSGNSEPVHALKGINLSFRKNEFVSILGPSGCGKTTLLNLIGGLDKYSDGDLLIAGKSTKKYSDRDWDVYRNHRVGFIFQSYNLIPHQTILGNVELALTIAGMSKKERQEKAKKALDKVGLKGMYNKHPNQLSGGQCQRVAIARALVNEPEILLADEPTGALDTVTSKQIMDLIAEIAKERLVIMVTHNPEIAEEYSSRIIRLLDGEVLEDSNPFVDEKVVKQDSYTTSKEKAKMSFATAFKLSFRNLLSKFKRTVLVCIAGSIGIVGVSTVLAVSSGIQNYIISMQDDMLSGNPISISEVTYDLNGLLDEASKFEQSEIVLENGVVNVSSMIQYLIKQSETLGNYNINNNITQDYIDYILAMPEEDRAAIVLDYGISMSNNIYTDWYYSTDSEGVEMSISSLIRMYTSVLEKTEFAEQSSYVSQLGDIFAQAPNNKEYLEEQYDVLKGKVATEANEIMVVINKDSQLTDLVLGQLGYYTQEEFINLVYEQTNNPNYDEEHKKMTFTYDEILGKTFKWYPNDSIFTKNENEQSKTVKPFIYHNTNEDNSLENGLELKVVGILQPKDEIMYGCLQTGFYYTEALTKKVLEENTTSELVKFVKEGNSQLVNNNTITSFLSEMETPMGKFPLPMGLSYTYTYYFEDNGVKETFENNYGFVGSDASSSFMAIFGSMMGGSISGGATSNENTTAYYTLSLRSMGGNDLANYVEIYPTSFDDKDRVTQYLDKWNEEGNIAVNGKVLSLSDRDKITYTDRLEIVITMINTMIDIITYALIVFTALSLLVSTVMIGIITYVSVVERIKEIGVIRSLGGRKKDVSHLFNAETFIIGLTSGLFGILITLGLSGIINLVVGHFSGIYTIAALPVDEAIIMIIVSVLLTSISGLIPARAAARKNPVEALRTE